jgi:hypothetical protein
MLSGFRDPEMSADMRTELSKGARFPAGPLKRPSGGWEIKDFSEESLPGRSFDEVKTTA